MTPSEYRLRMRAMNLRVIEEERQIYTLALAIRLFKTTDDKGEKYLFNDVRDLFDFERLEAEINGEQIEQKNESINELKENAMRLEMAKKIVEERRRKRESE